MSPKRSDYKTRKEYRWAKKVGGREWLTSRTFRNTGTLPGWSAFLTFVGIGLIEEALGAGADSPWGLLSLAGAGLAYVSVARWKQKTQANNEEISASLKARLDVVFSFSTLTTVWAYCIVTLVLAAALPIQSVAVGLIAGVPFTVVYYRTIGLKLRIREKRKKESKLARAVDTDNAADAAKSADVTDDPGISARPDSAAAPDHARAYRADPIEQIRKLSALRDQGVITEDEFEVKKTDLLGRV